MYSGTGRLRRSRYRSRAPPSCGSTPTPSPRRPASQPGRDRAALRRRGPAPRGFLRHDRAGGAGALHLPPDLLGDIPPAEHGLSGPDRHEQAAELVEIDPLVPPFALQDLRGDEPPRSSRNDGRGDRGRKTQVDQRGAAWAVQDLRRLQVEMGIADRMQAAQRAEDRPNRLRIPGRPPRRLGTGRDPKRKVLHQETAGAIAQVEEPRNADEVRVGDPLQEQELPADRSDRFRARAGVHDLQDARTAPVPVAHPDHRALAARMKQGDHLIGCGQVDRGRARIDPHRRITFTVETCSPERTRRIQ